MSKTIDELTGPINETLGRLGIEQAIAMLSEGFCPLCSGRSSAIPVVAPDEFRGDNRTPSASVSCQQCHVQWRSGPNPDSHLDWIEFSIYVYDHARLSITHNPPPEPEEEDEWEPDTW